MFAVSSKFRLRTFAASSLLVLSVASQAAVAACIPVKGTYDEHAVVGPECTSPVGVCTEGRFSGTVNGDYFTTVQTLTPTAATPLTGILLFTAGTAVDATLRGRTGTVVLQSSGWLRAVAPGEIADVQTIVSGTGGFAGATGTLFTYGNYVDGSGSSTYSGVICLP